MFERLIRASSLVLVLASAGCVRPSESSGFYGSLDKKDAQTTRRLAEVSQDEWALSRERLASVRAAQPERPYVERVRLSIFDPRTRKRYEARGAVAVSPDRAARMILIGPAGTTALDVWVTKDQFRFSVPALHYEKRGGSDPDEAVGLPVGMLRWWFLSPLGGRLLLGRSTASETAWLLRDGDATMTVRTDGMNFVAIRRAGGYLEGIEWRGRGVSPEAGARGLYLEGKFGLRVEVFVEEILPDAPEAGAFEDPTRVEDKGREL